MAMEDFKAAIYEGRVTDAASNVIGKPLQYFSEVPLNIAVVGEPGSGKSSFVNAMLGLRAGDPGAAETGIQTTTVDVKAFPHPHLLNVIFWDLPGKGAASFGEDVFAKINLNRFDFFIIVGAQRFRTIHADLVNEIQGMSKKFYFVRSNTDLDLEASKRQRPSDYNEERILLRIKDDCHEGLRREGATNPQVFLVSSYETKRFDFPLLWERLKNDLLGLRRKAFLLNLPSISLPVLNNKKTAMKKQILIRAFWLWIFAAIPIPGLSYFPARKVHSWCYHNFGLGDLSLRDLAQLVGKTAATLKAVMKPLSFISVFLWGFAELVRAVVIIGDYTYFQHFPLYGYLLSGGISLLSTYVMLNKFVSNATDNTQRVLTEALMCEAKKSI
ncbi:interferon-inducible GTPase 5-like [Anolis sagrei]|uniref:interferon-inducible GTPase 5-like n=1 Tax=Anolis sagrei TaxID=38937 RepID=UPI00352216B9